MSPFKHYHIDFISTSVVIYNIYFSVGISYNIDLLVLLLHPLSVESKVRLTSRQICRLGRPSGARSSRHVITPATDQATHRGQAQNTHNIQCNPQVHVFPGQVCLSWVEV